MASDYPGLNGLSLTNEDNETVNFHMAQTDEVETCTGIYRVKHAIAQAVGSIACTIEPTINK